jgi:branched-chain amino acid aminotransferase/4-amino-4-deoxychorismate lyase
VIPYDDRGLLLGDGLFETVLARQGELVLWDAHMGRLRAGCETLGLPPPDLAAARRACEQAIAEAGLGAARAAVRLTLTAGSGGRGLDRPAAMAPRLFATAAPAPRAETPARLATAHVRRNPHSPASRLKSLAYLDNVLARREAMAAGADEALMLNTRGEVASAAAANLFWLKDGRLFTPALDCGVLGGVMRAALLAAAHARGHAVAAVRIGEGELRAAEAVFLTNSLIGVRAVSALDGEPLTVSPMAQELATWVADVA